MSLPHRHAHEARLELYYAATIMRQKEARQQSFMKSREHFIASSITSAFGGEKERPPPARVYSKVLT